MSNSYLSVDEIHIYPHKDLITHTIAQDDTCPCIPRVECVQYIHAQTDVWIHTHASLDGREQLEHPLKWWRRIQRRLTGKLWRKALIEWENPDPNP